MMIPLDLEWRLAMDQFFSPFLTPVESLADFVIDTMILEKEFVRHRSIAMFCGIDDNDLDNDLDNNLLDSDIAYL